MPLLRRCFFIALAFEILLLGLLGIFVNPPLPVKTTSTSEEIIAEIYQPTITPQHLTHATAISQETTLHASPGQGRHSDVTDFVNTPNQTLASPQVPLETSHGPRLLYSPHPKIPPYLQTAELHVSVTLLFLIDSTGHFTTKLIQSSGYEELDAIALTTVSQWIFEPAQKNSLPTTSQIRLRIVFQVQ